MFFPFEPLVLNANIMAILIEPDGTENICVTVQYAIDWCKTHPGWTWRYNQYKY